MTHEVIRVDDVSKQFRIAQGGARTLKESIVNFRRTTYEEFWALRDVSCVIPDGETVGLIGPNGSGKTTLLKCIAGILNPTSGSVTVRGRIASLLELGAGFHPDLTGRENVYLNASILGLSRRDVDRVFDDIVDFAGPQIARHIDNQVKFYSSGMYVRLGFAVAINVDPQILLVDEVLAVGDERFQQKCLDKVREFQREGRTILFVSHSLEMVRQLCSSALFLHNGVLRYEGTPGDAIRAFRREVFGEIDESEAPSSGTTAAAGDDDLQPGIGSGAARVTEVRVQGRAQRQSVIETGDPFTVDVDLETREHLDHVVVGIVIFDEWEHVVFGTNTQLAGVPLDDVHGRASVHFSFPSIPLLSGRFTITVGLHSASDEIYDWQDRSWSFEVVNTTAFIGQTWAPHTVELRDVDVRSTRAEAG
jgi:ABC-2 type transport system ATP-binding protein